MHTWLAAGTLLVLSTGAALAQPAPPPPAPPPPGAPPAEAPAAADRHHGHHGPEMGMHGRHSGMAPGKAAFFRFRKGDAAVTVKCPDDEPVKACVDAASALLDKLQPPR